MNNEIINWLNEGPSWLQYAVELQLLNSKPNVHLALGDESIIKIVSRIKNNQVGIPVLKIGKVLYAKTENAYWDLFFLFVYSKIEKY